MPVLLTADSVHVREVWKHNLGDEIALIREIIDEYPYVAMDTEFPGVVLEPLGNFKNLSDRNYRSMKANVDVLKLIQLGLTFFDEKGNLPTCNTDKYCVWQFNFSDFNLEVDLYAKSSIELLSSSGIDFDLNKKEGISAFDFAELLMSSGAVLNDEVHWIVFHGSSDFGYLLKLLTAKTLPETQEKFFEIINTFFPTIYDLKHIMKFYGLYGGLNRLANSLGVERIGSSHQAGSDSLLTCLTFVKMKETFFNVLQEQEKYAGVLFGLGVEYEQNIRR